MNVVLGFLASIGFGTRRLLANLGYGLRLFLRLLALLPGALRRPQLIAQQVFFLGNYSLSIIAVSGLFVGFVSYYETYT